jgi:exonuclease III
VKIASYNINNVNKRLPVLLRWLRESKPDVVCLQELKCEQQNFPAKQLEKAGYNSAWVGQRSWNGVAILAKGNARMQNRHTTRGELAIFLSFYQRINQYKLIKTRCSRAFPMLKVYLYTAIHHA